MSNSHIVSNPNTHNQSTFLDGARDALVNVFTYLPVAFAFGFVGAMFADQMHLMPMFLQASFDFLLPALFLSFLLAAFEKKNLHIIITALLFSALGYLWLGLSFAIFAGIIAGMIIALIKYYGFDKHAKQGAQSHEH